MSPGENEVDLRTAARRAARREGLSLGDWLDHVVARKASGLGVAPEDLGAEQRASAVTEWLQQASSEGAASRPLRSTGPDRAAMEGRERRAAAFSRSRESSAWRGRSDERRAAMAGAAIPGATAASVPRTTVASSPRITEDRQTIETIPMPQSRASDKDDFGQIEAKLKSVFQTLDRRRMGEGETAPKDIPANPAPVTAQPATTRPRSLASAIAEIQGRQAALEPPDRAAGPVSPKPTTSATRAAGALLDEFSSYGRRGGDRAPRSSREDADVASLRHDIAALSRSLGELAPRDQVMSLEAAVRDLSTKMEASRDGGLRDMILAPVESLARDLRASVTELDPRHAVSELDREIRALGRKIEAVTTNGIDTASLKRIQEQTTEVRDLLTAAATRPSQADRPDEAGGLGSGASVTAALDEVRTVLAGLQGNHGFEALEQRVDGLAAKIDSALEHQIRPAALDGLARRIETVQASVERRLAVTAPPVDLAPLERKIGDLIGRVGAIQDHQTDLRGLEATVQRLAARVAEIGDVRTGAEVMSQLHAQIGQLASRIDRSDAGLTAIVSVERSLGELFAQLEETREAAVSAAEGAARTAARDTLRAAMLDHDRAGRPAPGSDPAIERVASELADFRAARDAVDQRLAVMLSTVNETLEHVATRLITLENNAVAAPMAQPALAMPAPIEPRASQPQRAAPPPAPTPEHPVAEHRPEVMDLGEADFPIEPGQAPVRRRSARNPAKAPDLKADSNQFIAAARRAAQAAAQDQAARTPSAPPAAPREKQAPAVDVGTGSVFQAGKAAVSNRRRPLLLGLAGLILLLGAVQIARLTLAKPIMGGDESSAKVASAQQRDADAALTPVTSLPSKSLASVPDALPSAATPDSAAAAAAAPAPVPSAPVAAAPAQPQPALPTLAMVPAAAKAAAHAQAEARQGLSDSLMALAQNGQAAAQYEVGVRLADGRGIARDPAAAAGWLEKAAKQGLAPAEYRLGSLYEKGTGVAKDPAKSVDWYQKAAEAGNVRAMHNLAVMSAEGASGKADYAKAAQWFGKASQMGVRDSQFNLAILYARGLGIEQSMMESYKWFAIAAAQGDEDAAKKRDDVAARLDPKSLAAAKTAVDDFKPIVPLKAANDIQPPPGGWDAVSPATTGTARRVSSL